MTINPILDLDVGIRYDGFLFQVLSADHSSVIGQLDVDIDASPSTVTLDTTRTIMRTCDSLRVSAHDLSAIDVLRDRVRPILRLQDGTDWSLGVLMFGADNRTPYSWGESWIPALYDETLIVQQPLQASIGLSTGQSVLTLFLQTVQALGLPVVDISGVADAPAATAVPWLAGSTLTTKALNDMANMLGCYPPFFRNDGAYTLKAAPPVGAAPDHVYELGGRVFDGTVVLTNNAFQAPNRYTVTSTSTDGSVIVGVFDLPDSSPNSFVNRGYRIVKDDPVSGIGTQELADLAAYIDALTDQKTSYKQATFNSAADPRHDVFDLVQLYGIMYQETGWSIQCNSGGPMTHTMIGFYD